jgi:hypothetical protein
MNSFSQLNTHGSQRVLVDDSRKAAVILDKTKITDIDQTFNLYPTYNSQAFDTKNYAVNIDEIINYATANARLTATILPSNMVSTYNASLVFNVVTPVTLSKPAANIYQLTGFQNNIDWDNNVSFTFNYPQGYAGLGIWYVTFVLDWYDETTAKAKSVTWNFYNTGHYYYALLPSRFDINPRLGVIKRSKANFVSNFEYKKSVQTSANLVDIFALRGFIELRLMRRSSAQLATPVTFTANVKIQNRLYTSSNISSRFVLTEPLVRLRLSKSNFATPVTFIPKINATFRSKPNLTSKFLSTSSLGVIRRTGSNRVSNASVYNNNYVDKGWAINRITTSSAIKWVTAKNDRVFIMLSDNTIRVYDWNANQVDNINYSDYVTNAINMQCDDNYNLYVSGGWTERMVKFRAYEGDLSKFVYNGYVGSFFRQANGHEIGAQYSLESNGHYIYKTPNITGSADSLVSSIYGTSMPSFTSDLYVVGFTSSGDYLNVIYIDSFGGSHRQLYKRSTSSWSLLSDTQLSSGIYYDNIPTGGWFSNGSSLYGIPSAYSQGYYNTPPYGIYHYRASNFDGKAWTNSAINKYATKNLVLMQGTSGIEAYTNLNNAIVNVLSPGVTAGNWPNKLVLSDNLSDNAEYMDGVKFASGLRGFVYGSGTQFKIFKER